MVEEEQKNEEGRGVGRAKIKKNERKQKQRKRRRNDGREKINFLNNLDGGWVVGGEKREEERERKK